MPSPIGIVTPGARNFNGASMKEIASTIPSQTKVAAPPTAAEAEFIPALLSHARNRRNGAGIR
ncbi:hypothetical protein GCM10027161_40100 [Microbispora hainanensis]